MFSKDGKRDNNYTTAESKEITRFPISTLHDLDEKVTGKIAEIVRGNGTGDADYRGYDRSEIAAAKTLLSQSSSTLKR